MDEPRIHSVFAETWLRARPQVEARIETIERALAAAERGERNDDPLRDAGTREAHRLAGLLGTFGLDRGSELARELEEGFLSHPDADAIAVLRARAGELRQLVAAARP